MLTYDTEFFYWRRGDTTPLSLRFRCNEFDCHCTNPSCTIGKVSKALINKLDKCREELERPIQIHSGYRCEARQQELAAQGYETAKGISQHTLGNAADVSADDMGGLLHLLRGEFQAIGVANTFVHVDLRDDRVRNWSYLSM